MDVASLFYPKLCLGCGRVGAYFCSHCQVKISSFPVSFCPKDTFIWLKNQGLTRKALCRFKYSLTTDLAKELTLLALVKQPLIVKRLKNRLRGFVITPIPLYWHRQNWRGFNQAEILAALMARQLDLEMTVSLIKRVKKTVPQSTLTKPQRQFNLEQAFTIVKAEKVKNKDILIFDDIYTTGETLKQAKKVLQQAGARRVFLMALAG